jgi:hypothetical protein
LTRYDTDAIFQRENILAERFFSAEAEKTIVAWQHDILSRAKSNPALIKKTGLRYIFYKPEREVSAFRSIKLYKSMKNLIVFAMLAVALTIFNGCQKEELTDRQLTEDEVQPQDVVQPDVYVEDNFLVFANFHTLDSLKKELNSYRFDELKSFEEKMGFKSAFSYRKELLDRADKLSASEIENYLDEVCKLNYFDKDNKEFKYPFYNEGYAKILNTEGKVKIGKTFYKFENDFEILTPDLTGVEIDNIPKNLERKIQLDASLPILKSGEELESTLLRNDRLRCSLKLIREEFVVEDWIIVDGQIVWGVVGHKWEVYYRFYSYKQFTFYKSDRPTYFNWKTKQAQIGNNDDFWYLNYYNANPYTERSTVERALIHFVIYDSGLIQSQYSSNVSAVHVSDFWSDYMSYIHGTLIYP